MIWLNDSDFLRFRLEIRIDGILGNFAYLYDNGFNFLLYKEIYHFTKSNKYEAMI